MLLRFEDLWPPASYVAAAIIVPSLGIRIAIIPMDIAGLERFCKEQKGFCECRGQWFRMQGPGCQKIRLVRSNKDRAHSDH